MPGSRQGIHTLTKDGENFLTEESEIDAALAEYWEKVFGPPKLQENAKDTLSGWLNDLGAEGKLQEAPPDWDGKWIDLACKRATTSSPGLDGIPYEAFKRAPGVWHILRRAGKELYDRGRRPTSLMSSIGPGSSVYLRRRRAPILP